MLRRADNVGVYHKPGFFTNKGPIVTTIGRNHHVSIAKASLVEYEGMLADSDQYPVLFLRIHPRNYWLFRRLWYWEDNGLNSAEIYALLVTRQQRETARVRRAQQIVAMDYAPTPTTRGAIPEDVRHYVWTRDRGLCRKCGSNVELQFDHIIPVAVGGGSSSDNLQLLCGPCNRRKGATI